MNDINIQSKNALLQDVKRQHHMQPTLQLTTYLQSKVHEYLTLYRNSQKHLDNFSDAQKSVRANTTRKI